ncbi:hypothetical protein J7E70_15625 [Variovorax paradoxus]|nr:hypothetical protein [Variovorax paradoxus]MBT2301891.1 hypothetical protein [Variovorax paradoxus]
MISAQDDLFGHQLPTTFDHVSSSDPAWVERYWYCGHRVPDGDVVLDLGFGLYPNRNVMDCFAGVTCEGVQTNFRGSRRLRGNPLATQVGPLSVQVLEGLRRHRLVLEPNESGLAFDLEFEASTHPHEEEPHFRRRNGRVTEDMVRMGQFGRLRGWLDVRGRRIEVTPQSWWAQRDHSWGIRVEMRTDETSPPVMQYPPFLFMWGQLQFEDCGIHLYLQERAPGQTFYLSGEIVSPLSEPPRKRSRITGFSQQMTWADDPLGQSLQAARLELALEDGSTRSLELDMMPARYFLKGGLYGGLNGWAHGDDRGPLHIACDQWRLDDPQARRLARTLSDHVARARMDGKTGWGIVEYGVGKGYPAYEQVQAHPAI